MNAEIDATDTSQNALKPRELSQQNDLNGLTAISRFQWLRAREIGNVLWPKQATRHISGARICKKWLDQGLVIQRKLPLSFGFAYVLSQKGSDFLTANGVPFARTGKRIGEMQTGKNKGWVPNKNSWQHDLLANSLLTLLLGSGCQIRTETEIVRKNTMQGKKIPDGLVKRGDKWLVIEVEREKKGGPEIRKMCQNLIDSANGCADYKFETPYGEDEFIRVNGAGLAFEDPLTADINHLPNVTANLQGLLAPGQSMNLTLFELKVSGGGVLDFIFSMPEIEAHYQYALEKSVFGHAWCDAKSVFAREPVTKIKYLKRIGFCPIELSIYKNSAGKWCAEISKTDEFGHDPRLLVTKEISGFSEEAAQRQAQKLLLLQPQYRAWFTNDWHKRNGLVEKIAPALSIDQL